MEGEQNKLHKIITWPNGKRYIGEFIDGKMEGVGILFMPNGKSYHGTFKNNLPDGNGRALYGRNHLYIGDFKKGKHHGNGILKTNKYIYTGEFINGERTGKGRLEFKDANGYFCIYKGEFNNGLFSGNGTLEKGLDKDFVLHFYYNFKYTGSFIDGKFNGEGELYEYNRDAVTTYFGEFRNGKYNGHGTMKIPYNFNQFVDENNEWWYDCSYGEYTGNFLDGKFSGLGVLVNNNRSKYEGEFKDGKYHGIGKFISDINKEENKIEEYEGEFSEGKFSGKGKMVKIKREVYEGEFINDECIGIIKYSDFQTPNSNFFYKNGIRIGTYSNSQIDKINTEKLKESRLLYLFLDIETTGLPKNKNGLITDLDNWPRIVQFSYLIYDENGFNINEINRYIRPVNFEITEDSTKIHGITNTYAVKYGQLINEVLFEFQRLARNVDYIVGHNIKFDLNVISSELLREEFSFELRESKSICTMLETIDYCKLRGSNGYKYPSLNELHFKLFGENIEGLHNSLSDIKATANCFWELRKLGVL